MPPEPTPSEGLNWAALRRDAWQSDWKLTNGRAGLLCLPAIALWIFVGLLSREYAWATLGAAGAVSVGFGAFQRLGEGRFRPMLVTLGGIAVGTWVGTVTAQAGWGYLVFVAGMAGFGFGAMTTLGYAAWWIGLQWMIALLVYGAHPAGPAPASRDALAVLAGGATQLGLLMALEPLTLHWFRRQQQPPLEISGSLFRALAANADPRTAGGRYALQVAVAVAVGVTVNHLWGLPNGYWIPMTAAILLKPRVHETAVRGLNRLLGTLAGAGVTTLLVAWLRPDPAELGLFLLLAVWACYAVQRVNYGVFATCITSYVVLLLSLLGLPETSVAWHRVLATLVGAAIALIAHARLRRLTR